jgi:CheY-like chemotaxis protein
LRGFDAETSRRLAETVERALRRALTILDAFVLAEQCESGMLQIAVRAVAVADILQAARAELGEHEGGRCTFMSDGGRTVVLADLARSAQVLRSVLQQLAMGASSDGAIEVRVVTDRSEPEIHVRSHGDPRTTPAAGWFASHGGGDGSTALRTAQQMMTLQGGGLDLVSGNEGGCEVVMRFRGAAVQAEAEGCEALHPSREAPKLAGRGSASNGRRILLVDDNAEVRRAYGEALAALGYRIIAAADAAQALSALEGNLPELAFIDLNLPGVNGFRLAQTIRGRRGDSIYLVMLSGIALDAATRKFAREAGFDDCIDKMAGPVALRELIESVLARKSR